MTYYNVSNPSLADMRKPLDDMGFTIGPRDPRINTKYAGSFMVVEGHEESELPTEDGANGPWAIVGDDLAVLIKQAWKCWADDAEEQMRRAIRLAELG